MNTEDIDIIQDFLRGDLTPEKEQIVKQRLTDDQRFRAAFNLERMQHEALDPNSWSFIEGETTEELEAYQALFKDAKTVQLKNKLKEINTNYQKNNKGSSGKKWIYYSIAAMLAVMFSIFSIFGNDKTTEELYAANFDASELPGLAVRGSSQDKLLLQAEELFTKNQFQKALPLLNEALDTAERNRGTLYLYKGISHMELNQFEAAETTFNTLIKSDLLDAQKGYWYKALLYVKMDDPAKAKPILASIVADNFYNYQKAAKLLKALK